MVNTEVFDIRSFCQFSSQKTLIKISNVTQVFFE